MISCPNIEPPSSPELSISSCSMFDLFNIKIGIQWTVPEYDGGSDIDSYHITVQNASGVTVEQHQPFGAERNVTFSLYLDEEYIINVTAMNCKTCKGCGTCAMGEACTSGLQGSKSTIAVHGIS